MTRWHTILDVILNGPDARPAIGAPSRAPLSYKDLKSLTKRVSNELSARGVSPQDRVAIVLPNGPEMATAFLSVSAFASSAPINPALRYEEFAHHLSDLRPKALIVNAHDKSPSIDAAAALGIKILEITHNDLDPAGWFDFKSSIDHQRNTLADEPPRPKNEALILLTSGTTSKPKRVPLTQENLIASAYNIVESLSLTHDDVGLNVMPLFHIHGLVGSLLASIAAGARIECTPGFNAFHTFEWMRDSKPTWYTAVPTMHQAILNRAGRNADIIKDLNLRFIRSSSAALSPALMVELEAVFQAPVIEAYAMTEAAHQMASNALPPATRIPGTVGKPAGPEIAIMDQSGNLLPHKTVGEFVIRGDNVFSAYENNETANQQAFHKGWFRTGDQGTISPQGVVQITGRIKEIINRGGEKIAPLEVDEVIADHPAVQQVVTFALPHPTLGEDVAAAVVLKDGKTATQQHIQAYARKRLSAFKVPRHIYFLDDIPKSATGKIQRIGLANKLGLTQ